MKPATRDQERDRGQADDDTVHLSVIHLFPLHIAGSTRSGGVYFDRIYRIHRIHRIHRIYRIYRIYMILEDTL